MTETIVAILGTSAVAAAVGAWFGRRKTDAEATKLRAALEKEWEKIQKEGKGKKYLLTFQKALSWLDSNNGGALVPPAQMGKKIPLGRPRKGKKLTPPSLKTFGWHKDDPDEKDSLNELKAFPLPIKPEEEDAHQIGQALEMALERYNKLRHSIGDNDVIGVRNAVNNPKWMLMEAAKDDVERLERHYAQARGKSVEQKALEIGRMLGGGHTFRRVDGFVKGGFTGERPDKLGRRMCYQDGKRVPCPKKEGEIPKNPKPADEEGGKVNSPDTTTPAEKKPVDLKPVSPNDEAVKNEVLRVGQEWADKLSIFSFGPERYADAMKRDAETAYSRVARDADGKYIGHMLSHPIGNLNELVPGNGYSEQTPYVRNIMVDPTVHKSGIARQMLHDFADRIIDDPNLPADDKRVVLDTPVTNTQAVNYYDKLGFDRAGSFKYGDNTFYRFEIPADRLKENTKPKEPPTATADGPMPADASTKGPPQTVDRAISIMRRMGDTIAGDKEVADYFAGVPDTASDAEWRFGGGRFKLWKEFGKFRISAQDYTNDEEQKFAERVNAALNGESTVDSLPEGGKYWKESPASTPKKPAAKKPAVKPPSVRKRTPKKPTLKPKKS